MNALYKNSRGKLTEKKIPQAILTAEQVIEIRRRYRDGRGELSQKELAREYGVSAKQVSKIISRQCWGHLA